MPIRYVGLPCPKFESRKDIRWLGILVRLQGFDDETSKISSLLELAGNFRVESKAPKSVRPIRNLKKEYM
jgi:hypothetical protein